VIEKSKTIAADSEIEMMLSIENVDLMSLIE
jgi:hypothetical protein